MPRKDRVLVGKAGSIKWKRAHVRRVIGVGLQAYQRHCERSEAIQLYFLRVSRKLDCFVASAPRNDGVGVSIRFQAPRIRRHTLAISRRTSPEVCYQIPALSNQRARGGRAPDAPDSRVCNGSG